MFHAMAENLKDDAFDKVSPQLFEWIKRICATLPCPDCSQHAIAFLKTVKPHQIANKNDFRQMLCVFHNLVNRRKHRPAFPPQNLDMYKTTRVSPAINEFLTHYNTTGNIKLMADAQQRTHTVHQFKKFLISSWGAFDNW